MTGATLVGTGMHDNAFDMELYKRQKEAFRGDDLSGYPSFRNSIRVLCDVIGQVTPEMNFPEVVDFLIAHPSLMQPTRDFIITASKDDPEAGSSLDRKLGWALALRALGH